MQDAGKYLETAILGDVVGAPVPVFGREDLLETDFYNWLWEYSLEDEYSWTIDSAKYYLFLEELSHFLAAVLYKRWSVSADVDIEPELDELIDAAFTKYPFHVLEAPFPVYSCVNHALDDNYFDVDDHYKLADTLGKVLDRTAASLCGWNSCGIEKEILYMAGEREDDPRPCFKASGWQYTINKIETMLAYSAFETTGIYAAMIDMKDICNVYDCDESMSLIEMETMLAINADKQSKCVIVIMPEWQEMGADVIRFTTFLDALKLVPEDIDTVIAMTVSSGPLTDLSLKRFIENTGVPVLADVRSEEVRLPDLLGNTVCSENDNFTSNGWIYTGDITEDVLSEIDDVSSAMVLDSIASMSGVMQAARYDMKYMLDYLLDEENKDDKNMREREEICKRVLYALSEGAIDWRDDQVDMSYAFTAKGHILNGIYNDMSERGKQGDSFPKTKLLEDFKQLAIAEGLLQDRFQTLLFNESACPFDEWLDKTYEKAKNAGVASSIGAYLAGVPMSDIIA